MMPARPACMRAATIYADLDRASRALGADPHGLVAILYDDLLLALGVARRAILRGDRSLFDERKGRAILLLGALDQGLDHRQNAALAAALSATYQGLSNALARAGPIDAGSVIERVAASITELADAWDQIAKTR
jgi:flagellar secretion chaperone FliS